ncbi:acetylcholinesterase-like [Diadema antillarum]|uniref:acetylcholinesterase-like n=1 Tax=Diadema antillarum TaxID=105358 RepID=UPI003A83F2B9
MQSFRTIWAVFAVLVTVNSQNPQVRVKEGILVGKTVHFSEDVYIGKSRDIDVFLGVPYADPPERFVPPQPKAAWDGERNASEFSPGCLQTPYESSPVPVMSEDCLYLNIYAPSPVQSSAGIPVMVWIHGGSFSADTAMSYDYSGIPLVTVGDVIMVAINYRLGVFAQFSTEDDVAPGNFGMMDQVAALKWINENIAAFGGDKDKITIFGESAGSSSVGFHILSKLSRGYFTQAMMQSGSAFDLWAFLDDPERERRLSAQLGVAMGCDTSSSDALVECLKLQDGMALLAAADEIYWSDGGYPVTLDGTFLDDTPKNLYDKGDFARVPLLIGFNRDEGTLTPFSYFPRYVGSPTPPQISRDFFEWYVGYILTSYGMGDAALIDAAWQEYVDWTIADDPSADYFRPLVDFGTDFDVASHMDRTARIHASANLPVFKYFMTHEPSKSFFQYGDSYPSTPWLGAGHGEDLTFVFGIPFIDELYNIKGHNMTEEENELSVKFMEFWTNFVKSGDPSKPSEGAPEGSGRDLWPPYTIPELHHKEMAPELRVGRAARARGCHFWNVHIPSLMVFTSDIGEEEKEWREGYAGWKDDMASWQQTFEDYKNGAICN